MKGVDYYVFYNGFLNMYFVGKNTEGNRLCGSIVKGPMTYNAAQLWISKNT